jgi:hypothetical protein
MRHTQAFAFHKSHFAVPTKIICPRIAGFSKNKEALGIPRTPGYPSSEVYEKILVSFVFKVDNQVMPSLIETSDS